MKLRFEGCCDEVMNLHTEAESLLGKPTDVDHDKWIPYEYEYNRDRFEKLLKQAVAKGNCWFEIVIESPTKAWIEWIDWIDWQDDLHEMIINTPKLFGGEREWWAYVALPLNNNMERENALSYLFGFLAGISTLENESIE